MGTRPRRAGRDRLVKRRGEAALADLIRTGPPQGREDDVGRLRGRAAKANSVVAYDEALWSPDACGPVHERVENSLCRGIAAYYELRQLLAMPVLADRPQVSGRTGSATSRSGCISDR